MRARLLIVEDDPALAAVLEEFLGESFTVVRTGRGDEALRLAARTPFDLILTDIVLPGADGRAILRRFAGDPARTLVILMTGYSGIADATEAVAEGAWDFISKPFALPELQVRLANAHRYQQALRRIQALEQELAEASRWTRSGLRAYAGGEP